MDNKNKAEQQKHCSTCSIDLTDDNKVKGKNLCKKCHGIKCHEYYEKNILSGKLAKQEEKSKVIKTCNHCSVQLKRISIIMITTFN